MALPTLRPSWVNHFKTPTELTSRNIQRSSDMRVINDHNYKYFTGVSNNAQKNQEWTSRDSYMKSMTAVDKLFDAIEVSEKKTRLEKRRMELKQLLDSENKMYQQELKRYRTQDLPSMQKKVDSLNHWKEKKRKQLADEKLHEHWVQNDSRLRKLKAETQESCVVDSWKEQVEERNQITIQDEETSRKIDEQLEIQRLAADKESELILSNRKARNRQHAEQLQEQMKQLKEQEKATMILKREEEILAQNDRLLQEAEERRISFECNRKKKEHGMFLIHQYKEQLKRKSKQIQDSLQLDLEILKEIADQEKEELEVKSVRREHLKADAEYMKQVIADQLRLEKTREAEVDMLYRDEAARQYRKREAEWEREQLARERLIKSVLDERQNQIQEKLEKVHKQKQQSIIERERLMAQIEDTKCLTQRDQEKSIQAKHERREEILHQIHDKEIDAAKERRIELQNEQKTRLHEQRQDMLLQDEADKLTSRRDVAAPSFRRRRIAFT